MSNVQAGALNEKLRLSLEAIRKLKGEIRELKTFEGPIAVIGTSCRFPGEVYTPEQYWRLLMERKDSVAEIPSGRWDIEGFYDPDPEALGKMYVKKGGFLRDIDLFDASLFGISPNEAGAIDPQQRLLLQAAWETFEHAGLDAGRLRGSNTGVFIGIVPADYTYLRAYSDNYKALQPYDATGNANSTAAGRISYTFDLRGPAIAMDTACSSSLVAIHTACQSLLKGESDLALAGGSSIILLPNAHIIFSRMKALSPTGSCKSFDAAADGFIRSEGCGMVLLKRLKDAVRDGDPVLAVIRGTAINQDGHSNGMTAPNGLAQEEVIRTALANANIHPSDIRYIETHGTGTPLGDPVEVEAINKVFSKERAADNLLYLGSVKANLGHLEAAAGIASFIKAVLSVQHRTVPAQIHFHTPSPHISWKDFVRVPTEAISLPEGSAPMTVGVSSFGLSGTNAHAVIQEYVPAETKTRPTSEGAQGAGSTASASGGEGLTGRAAHLFTLSARSPKALEELAARYEQHLRSHPEITLDDLCYTTSTGRSPFPFRAALVITSKEELLPQLQQLSAGTAPPQLLRGTTGAGKRPAIALLFTGQGSQYRSMGKALYEQEPFFKNTVDECARILEKWLDRPLLQLLFGDAETEDLIRETRYAQPALFTIGYALYKLWHHWGLMPRWVLGHSVGEYAAACAAGIFSLEDGLMLVAERGRLMQELPEKGSMLSVVGKTSVVMALVREYAGLSIAAFNSTDNIVVSGNETQLSQLSDKLKAMGLQAKPLNVSHGFHSPLMEPMLAAFSKVAASVHYSKPRLSVLSNVTGDGTADMANPEYWTRHILAPVQFEESIRTLDKAECSIFMEIGTRPVLTTLGKQILPDKLFIPGLQEKREDREEMLRAMATLYLHGIDFNRELVFPHEGARRIFLPAYPFQAQRHWVPQIAITPFRSHPDESEDEIKAGAAAEWLYDVEWQPLEWKQPLESNQPLERKQPLESNQPPERKQPLESNQPLERKQPLERSQPTRGQQEEWLFIADRAIPDGSLSADPLAAALRDQGQSVRELSRETEFTHIRFNEKKKLLYLLPPLPSGGSSGHSAFLAGRMMKLVSLIKTLSSAGASTAVLWILSPSDSPYHLALEGWCRSLAIEHADSWGGLIDHDGSMSSSELAEQLLRLHMDQPSEDRIRITKNGCWVPRLRQMPLPDPSPLNFSRHAAYLVTGGLGGLGLAVAGWMAERGARRILLLGRNGLPPRVEWSRPEVAEPLASRIAAVRRLEQMGAHIEVLTIDIADEGAFSRWLDNYNAEGHPPIKGVVHAAGTATYREMTAIDPGFLQQQLAAKVTGASVLDQHLGDSLDFFILFSSAAAILNSPGLAVYAAGNAFLDALALGRRAKGLPALSINWGAWENLGMTAGELPSFRLPMPFIPVTTGLQLLEKIWNQQGQMAILPIDWADWREKYTTTAPLLKALMQRTGGEIKQPVLTAFARLADIPSAQRLSWLQEYLQQRIARVLRMDAGEIEPDVPLNNYGLDSMMALDLRNGLQRDLSIVIRMADLVRGPSIIQLAGILAAAYAGQEQDPPSGKKVHLEEPEEKLQPLSQGQQALYALHAMDPGNPAYNIAFSARIVSPFDSNAAREAFKRLVVRHPMLRARFVQVTSQVQQFIRPATEEELFTFETIDASSWEETELYRQVQAAHRIPFRLTEDPLMRVHLFGDKTTASCVLLITFHHIICDGFSMWSLLEEFSKMYDEERGLVTKEILAPLTFNYFDHIRWEEQLLTGQEGEKMWEYWRQQLSGPLPLLRTRHSQDGDSGYVNKGATFRMRIEEDIVIRFRQFSQQQGVTLFTSALTVFKLLLHRYTGQEDILVGSPVSGRNHSELTGLAGDFINMVTIRTRIETGDDFISLLGKVKESVLGGLAHQDYPFPLVVKRLQPKRQPGRSPIFQVIFILQQPQQSKGLIDLMAGKPAEWGSLSLQPFAIPQQEGQFDLTLELIESADRLLGVFRYNTFLFEEITIRRMAEHFIKLMETVVAYPTLRQVPCLFPTLALKCV